MSPSDPRTPSKVRVPALVAAVLTGVLALGLLVSGAGLLWADGQRDDRGYLSTDRHRFSSATPALVTENLDVDLGGAEWLVDGSDLGDVRLSLEPESSKPVFAGIARTSDVERYLDGVAYTTVDDLDLDLAGGVDYRHRDTAGDRRADRPADQDIWVASTTGADAQDLTWNVRDGDWSVVVMNADGSRGVHADITAGAKVSVLDELAWTAIGGGVILVIVTGGLVLLALRPRRPATTPAAAASPAPSPRPYTS